PLIDRLTPFASVAILLDPSSPSVSSIPHSTFHIPHFLVLDSLRLLRVLRSDPRYEGVRFAVVGAGSGALPALLTASLDENIDAVALSFSSSSTLSPDLSPSFSEPDLLALLVPRSLFLALGGPIDHETVTRLEKLYAGVSASGPFGSGDPGVFPEQVSSWLEALFSTP
ncbi:MAG: hypothetical protein V2A58_02250, partial [Planctomycetota bacterium]